MTRSITHAVALAVSCIVPLLPVTSRAADHDTADIERIVTQAIQPVMQQYDVPGMAVGIVMPGQTHVYNYGAASRATKRPVTDMTLFEIGSVSKTFTATLAGYAQISGILSLSDPVGTDFPSLQGSRFGQVSLLELGTHTPGGLPLQVPDNVTNTDQLMAYLRHWQPAYTPGTYRTYTNVGIGMLGMITARSLHGTFATLMADKVFSRLGMKHTYLDVPEARMADYAQGYTTTNAPIRMVRGVLGMEAYGIRTTASDLLRFVAANMRLLDLDATLQRAITETHTGYFKVGVMTQDLMWEQFQDPVTLQDLLAGNSDKMLLQANPATRLAPPSQPRDDVLINKTGSTNGFATYVAFIPAKRIGIVILANRTYPIRARVTAAYDILTRLNDGAPKH